MQRAIAETTIPTDTLIKRHCNDTTFLNYHIYEIMLKKILIALLVISFLLELTLTLGCFIAPEKVLATLQLKNEPSLNLPVFLIGWFLLLITIFILYFIIAVAQNKTGYQPFLYLLCLWWVGIGFAIYLKTDMATNLFSDSLKGVLLAFFTYRLSNKK